ncbi:peroxiredoxin [Alkalilimnicola sp. S0819]|uniref:peroxiredoxin n=1 Tax=Alkalilimnicola sp. S0819 TaxID=2613922 RepID=UPI0012616EBF|nr:peroxiredoxin [Alkalilimnicola sp. S0819]KAB7627455.1 peroxiredoxin [Alkalilimnicola sp. S0819]MPQ15604.1 peroxiredoxin [Alkalilimnicola sp. S0819]
MANKLLIVMANIDPDCGPGVGVPLRQAAVAASMEYDVEVIFAGVTGRLALPGAAERVEIGDKCGKNAYQMIREAHEEGVTFKVGTSVVELYGEEFIAEVAEIVGGAYVISEAMDDETVTFTY